MRDLPIYAAVLLCSIAGTLWLLRPAWRAYIVPAVAALAGALGAWLLARSGQRGADAPTREEAKALPDAPTPQVLPLPEQEAPDYSEGDGTIEVDRDAFRDFIERSRRAARRHEGDE